MKAGQGITLIELVVSASLMGLLFFSGLQLLSTAFSVQSALTQTKKGFSTSRIRLETELRHRLQAATLIEIRDSGSMLRARHFQLRFLKRQTCGGWLLLIQEENRAPRELFHWTSAKVRSQPQFTFAWDRQSPHLLNIFLEKPEPALSIWIRNNS